MCDKKNIVLAYCQPCDVRGVWNSLGPFFVLLPKSQEVDCVCVCVCVKYSGKPDALFQCEEEKECPRKV